MCVYLGCRYALVSEHLLNLSNAGTSRQQMRSEGVAEGVRTHLLLYARAFYSLTDYGKYHDAGKFSASIVQEEDIFVAMVSLTTVVKVYHYSLTSRSIYRHKALLVAFAYDTDVPLAEE